MPQREEGNDEESCETPAYVKHGTVAPEGQCRDCAQGFLSPSREGFEYFGPDDGGLKFWFCRYCGSNHVTVYIEDGVIIEQGDLY
jgi:hypothetical protein